MCNRFGLTRIAACGVSPLPAAGDEVLLSLGVSQPDWLRYSTTPGCTGQKGSAVLVAAAALKFPGFGFPGCSTKTLGARLAFYCHIRRDEPASQFQHHLPLWVQSRAQLIRVPLASTGGPTNC